MIASNLRPWMVMFAIELTSVPADDSKGRSEIAEQYKQSAIECGIVSFQEPVKVFGGDELYNGNWVEPKEPIKIENEESVISGKWVEPKDPIVIENDPSPYNGVWTAPKDAISIENSTSSYQGRWVDPLYWGDGT